jgi:hypothetical protein
MCESLLVEILHCTIGLQRRSRPVDFLYNQAMASLVIISDIISTKVESGQVDAQMSSRDAGEQVDRCTGVYAQGTHVQRFRLTPYPADDLTKIEIKGEIEQTDNLLSIHYSVTGEINAILLPPVSDVPSRKHDLWKSTCFEFFLARKGQPDYWEFNLSPSGDWNVYRMDAYRQVDMRAEPAFTQLPFEFRQTSDEHSLTISADLSPILKPGQALQIGIAAVMQTQDRRAIYWALVHPRAATAQVDFHLRESFILEL